MCVLGKYKTDYGVVRPFEVKLRVIKELKYLVSLCVCQANKQMKQPQEALPGKALQVKNLSLQGAASSKVQVPHDD